MKNFKKLWAVALMLAASFAMVSCDEEEPIVEVQDGLNVTVGYYLALEGEDPLATTQLENEVVAGDDFGTLDREGFYSSFIYLSSGSYNLVDVQETDGERSVETSYGGSMETITDEASGCDFNDYSIVNVTADGAAFNIANEGLYIVSFDESTSELIINQLETVGLIGSATSKGWDGATADVSLTGSVSSDGGSYVAEGIVLRTGEMKLRFNCRWDIDRREDNTLPFSDEENGYAVFTNFGGTTDQLAYGNVGSNIAVSQDGEYTVTVTWDPATGFSLELERTGDAPELTFDPAEWDWGVIGSVTADIYDADRDMVYVGESEGTYTWATVVWFADANLDGGDTGARRFKLRVNDDWGYNLGGTIAADGVETALVRDGGDITAPSGGAYYIALSTSDDGTTWNATMTDMGWSLIGEGSPSGNWDDDTALTVQAAVDGVVTYTFSGAFTGGAYKVRANSDWVLNLGGDMSNLGFNGDNLNIDAGSYDFVLSFDGETYSASATAQ